MDDDTTSVPYARTVRGAGGRIRLVVLAFSLVVLVGCAPNSALAKQQSTRSACSGLIGLEKTGPVTPGQTSALDVLFHDPHFAGGSPLAVAARAVIAARRAGKLVGGAERTALDDACASAEGGLVLSLWLVAGLVLLGTAVVMAILSILAPKKGRTATMFSAFIVGAVLLVHAT